MNTLKRVEVGILTVTRLRTREKGRLFLDLLYATAPEYAPGRFNTHEPVNRPFNPIDYTDAMQSWGMGFLWRGRRASVAGQIVMGPLKVHDAVYISMSPGAFSSTVVELWLSRMSERFGVEFGYVHGHPRQATLDTDRYCRNMMPFSQVITTHHLRDGIPDCPWALLLGPAYVGLFGRERLLGTPVDRVVPMGAALFLQLTGTITDVVERRDQFDRIRDATKSHLNKNAFRDSGNTVQIPTFVGPDRGVE